MSNRLPNWLAARLLFQGLLIFALLLGPVANIGALQPLDGGCSTSCPCGDETETTDAPCDDELAEHADEHRGQDLDDCGDDCSECDCDTGIMTAVAPAAADHWPGRIPDARSARVYPPPIQAAGADIFIPPRR